MGVENPEGIDYVLVSNGPDLDSDMPRDKQPVAIYDPTNGLKSNGDIIKYE